MKLLNLPCLSRSPAPLLSPYPLSLYPQRSTHAPEQKQRVKQSHEKRSEPTAIEMVFDLL